MSDRLASVLFWLFTACLVIPVLFAVVAYGLALNGSL